MNGVFQEVLFGMAVVLQNNLLSSSFYCKYLMNDVIFKVENLEEC